MLCQRESNVWQLKLNMMRLANVRKLWFGLEVVVQLKLFIIVMLLLPFVRVVKGFVVLLHSKFIMFKITFSVV